VGFTATLTTNKSHTSSFYTHIYTQLLAVSYITYQQGCICQDSHVCNGSL